MYGQMIFNKGAKTIQGKRTVLKNGVGKTGYSLQNNDIEPLSATIYKKLIQNVSKPKCKS